MSARTPASLLDAALRSAPARPLLTCYDDATGERSELSVATFATWVAKTANLCRDDLGLDPGARVAVDLPLHWQALVWCQACWSAGLEVVLAGPDGGPVAADVLVVPLEGSTALAPAAGEVVGLGLGPLGLPVPGPVPGAVTVDYDREVPGQGDRFAPPPGAADPGLAALDAAGSRSSAAELLERADRTVEHWSLSAADRVLTAAGRLDEAALLATLLGPLASGAGAVLCRHADLADDATLARRAATEGVTAVTAESRFRLPGVRPLD